MNDVTRVKTLLLATEIWRTHGGVQRYMRMLDGLLSSRSRQSFTNSLLDSGDDAGDSKTIKYFCAGKKTLYVSRSLDVAVNNSDLVAIVGHLSLLPVAYLLFRLHLLRNFILVLHGIESWHRVSWLKRVAARASFAVVATTEYTAEEFCHHNNVDKSRVVIIPLASSMRFEPIPRNSSSPLRVITISRLSRADAYKGFDASLRSIRLARDNGVKVCLDIIGDGDDRARLVDLASKLDIADIVCFHGSVTDTEIQKIVRECSVFLLPSKKEGFGIVYAEAMAAGLPCIAGNHGGAPEVVDHGVNGYLVEYNDVEQIAFYIRALANSPELYQSLSKAALRKAAAMSPSKMASSWNEVLNLMETSTLSEIGPP